MRNVILFTLCGCFVPVLFDLYLGIGGAPLWIGYTLGMIALGRTLFNRSISESDVESNTVTEFVRWILTEQGAAEISWTGKIRIKSEENNYTLDFKIIDDNTHVPNEADARRSSES